MYSNGTLPLPLPLDALLDARCVYGYPKSAISPYIYMGSHFSFYSQQSYGFVPVLCKSSTKQTQFPI